MLLVTLSAPGGTEAGTTGLGAGGGFGPSFGAGVTLPGGAGFGVSFVPALRAGKL